VGSGRGHAILAAVRLVEIRLLDGPNVYRLEPTVKVEVGVGRRRTWFGQRLPAMYARVRLGAPVPRRAAPRSVADLAAWIGTLHHQSGADAWLVTEGRATSPGRARIPVSIHRTSEPGIWVVAYPWREDGRAQAIAEAALRLVDLDLDSRTTRPATRRTTGRRGRSRTLTRALRTIQDAATGAPAWIRDPDRRMPVISISGTNGKTTTTRMISHILRTAGRHTGATTSDGVLFDEVLVEAGDLTGPYGARSVLANPDVDVAVLETARGGMMLRGVGYESNDASVLTNVSSDHMDLYGVHTLPELAEVKSVICRMTRPDGVVVLNADDDLVAAVAARVRAQVWLFSMAPRSAKIRRHLARGGTAFVLEGDSLVEVDAEGRRPIIAVADVPATLHGLARHNIANGLAAAAGARALGATHEQVADGLRSFAPSAEQAPGRLNLYRRGDTTVIVDFAHNEAGVSAVLDVAAGLVGDSRARAGQRSLCIIIGTAGDRPDDTLRGIAKVAADRADRVVIKETLGYLRGRTRESVVGELRAGITIGGGDGRHAALYEDEPSAVRGELGEDGLLTGTGLPGLLVVMCHEDRAGVVAALSDRGFVPV
jgi:cyanophycin synthetase